MFTGDKGVLIVMPQTEQEALGTKMAAQMSLVILLLGHIILHVVCLPKTLTSPLCSLAYFVGILPLNLL